ncbi:MAG: hypothetical protein BroJett031_28680 [Betaproteobacteria bacterium]|nr:MAG: hypothetical protein BroJett031_28680 [Betaproteobacteria bacterium]
MLPKGREYPTLILREDTAHRVLLDQAVAATCINLVAEERKRCDDRDRANRYTEKQ